MSPELLPEDPWLVAADVKVAAIETSFGKQANRALRFWFVTSSMYGCELSERDVAHEVAFANSVASAGRSNVSSTLSSMLLNKPPAVKFEDPINNVAQVAPLNM